MATMQDMTRNICLEYLETQREDAAYDYIKLRELYIFENTEQKCTGEYLECLRLATKLHEIIANLTPEKLDEQPYEESVKVIDRYISVKDFTARVLFQYYEFEQ